MASWFISWQTSVCLLQYRRLPWIHEFLKQPGWYDIKCGWFVCHPSQKALNLICCDKGNSSWQKLTCTCNFCPSDASCDARVAARSLILETLAMKYSARACDQSGGDSPAAAAAGGWIIKGIKTAVQLGQLVRFFYHSNTNYTKPGVSMAASGKAIHY